MDDDVESTWSSLYLEPEHRGASPAPIPIELAPGARMIPIKDIPSIKGPAFYTPQSPPGTSYEQYRKWIRNMQAPHHFDIDEGEVEVVGGLGQVEGAELMMWVLEERLTPRPSQYISDLMNTLFKKE